MQAYWKRNGRYLRDGLITSIILAAVMGGLVSLFVSIGNPILPPADPVSVLPPEESIGYPARGQDIDVRSFATRLPPPPLDALPYEVRNPLDNGPDVDVKRRWLWIPDGETI
ncbi:MAG: hypothetical protein AAF787_18355, partial [Chloroflexota bacterium]